MNVNQIIFSPLLVIQCQETIDGVVAEFYRKKILPKHWDCHAGEADRFRPDAKPIDDHLLLVRTEINRHCNILLSSQEIVTVRDVKGSSQIKGARRQTFLTLFRLFSKHFG